MAMNRQVRTEEKMKAVAIKRSLGVFMDSSAGGQDWFVMLISEDDRVWHQHVCPQGPLAAIQILSAFAADYIDKS